VYVNRQYTVPYDSSSKVARKQIPYDSNLAIHTAQKVQGNEEGECNYSICHMEVICLSSVTIKHVLEEGE
jgi:hypothetical protein